MKLLSWGLGISPKFAEWRMWKHVYQTGLHPWDMTPGFFPDSLLCSAGSSLTQMFWNAGGFPFRCLTMLCSPKTTPLTQLGAPSDVKFRSNRVYEFLPVAASHSQSQTSRRHDPVYAWILLPVLMCPNGVPALHFQCYSSFVRSQFRPCSHRKPRLVNYKLRPMRPEYEQLFMLTLVLVHGLEKESHSCWLYQWTILCYHTRELIFIFQKMA